MKKVSLVASLCCILGLLWAGNSLNVYGEELIQIINDQEDVISFDDHWEYRNPQKDAYGEDETWSNTVDATMNYEFEGNSIKVYGTKNKKQGQMAISIDGGEEIIIDNYSDQREKQALLFETTNLQEGIHILTVKVLGIHNELAEDSRVTIDYIEVSYEESVGNEVTITHDQKSTANGHFDYSASWNVSDLHWSNVKNTYATIRFNGESIDIYGVKGPEQGIMAVSIDGGSEIEVDNYNSSKEEGLLFSATDLGSGGHKITLRVTGDRNNDALDNKLSLSKATYIYDDTPILDARGMARIPSEQLTVSSTSEVQGYEIGKAFDDNPTTLWKADSQNGYSITIDMNQVYSIGKIGMLPDEDNIKRGRIRKLSIYSSVDGESYDLLLSNVAFGSNEWGSRQQAIDGGFDVDVEDLIYYLDLPEDVDAKYIRIDVHSSWDGNSVAGEFRVYERLEIEPKVQSRKPIIQSLPLEAYGDINLGQKVLIEKGLQIQAWVPIEGSGRREINRNDFDNLNLTGVANYSKRSLYPTKFLEENPDVMWSASKFPFGKGTVDQKPPTDGSISPLIPQEMLDNKDMAVSICVGDEQEYGHSSQRVNTLAWIDYLREIFPNAIIHTNQVQGQFRGKENWDHYMANGKPDLLTYDYYVYSTSGGDNYISANIWGTLRGHREYALKGIDGTSTRPIPFGQYLGGYKTASGSYGDGWYEFTESQKYYIPYFSMAAGAKWFDLFRVEYDQFYGMLFGRDGWPTHHYYEYAELFRQMQNLGPHLTRLNNIDLRVLPGQFMRNGEIVDGYMATDVPDSYRFGQWSSTSNPEYGIKNIDVENIGTQNDGLDGDVLVGYFEALPGLSEDQLGFFTNNSPKYFMVVNGLTSGNGKKPEEQHGTLEETKQKITLTLDKVGTLKRVSRYTGEVEDVEYTETEEGYIVELILGGGSGDLFFWED